MDGVCLAIILLVSLLNIIMVKKEDRVFVNPSITFSFLWLGIVFLSQIKLFDLYQASKEAYFIIMIGVVAFTIGGKVVERCCRSVNASKQSGSKLIVTNRLNYTILTCITLICISAYLPQLILSIRHMMNGVSLNDVRGYLQDADYSTGWANFLGNYFLLPCATVIELLGPLDYWVGKRNKCFCSLSIILVLVRTFGSGGRTPLFNFVLYFVGAYIFACHRKSSLAKPVRAKDKRKFRVYAQIGIFGLSLVTLMRAAGSLVRKLYFYFAMAPVLLTRWCDTISANNYHGYGIVSFNGFFYIIDYFRKNLTGGNYLPRIIEAYKLIADTDSLWLRITSSGTTANAYVSCFWFFYADAGILGVFILSLLWGAVSMLMYHRAARGTDLRCTAAYLLLFQSIFFSFIRFPFGKAYYLISFLMVYMLAFKKKRIATR